MTYDPKIFIRGYTAPTYRMLCYTASFECAVNDVELRRDLVFEAENSVAGPERILLSGDAQTGGDGILLSGEDGNLMVTNSEGLSFVGHDVEFIES